MRFQFLDRRYAILSMFALAILVLSVGAGSARGEEFGVSADRIVFGQVAALSGPAAELGAGMRTGILAAFAEAKRNGKIQGRDLVLISRDDGYEPNNTIAATSQLLGDNVFALIGSVGTPTTNAILPLIAENRIPLIGPFTGSEGLRNPLNPLIINVRASYFQETEVMVDHLTKDLGYNRIAIFYQDDSFGRAGLTGVQRALERRGLKLVSEGSYQRNTTAVRGALSDITAGNPEAVILIGAYAPCAEFIKLAHERKMNSTFMAISFVGPEAFARALGTDGAGVFVTQVVPFPYDSSSMPLVAEYQAALTASDPAATPSFVSLEGYVVGRLVVTALKRIDGPITRTALLQSIFSSGSFDLGGMELSFSAENNQGSNRVFLTEIGDHGSFSAVETLKHPETTVGNLVPTIQ